MKIKFLLTAAILSTSVFCFGARAVLADTPGYCPSAGVNIIYDAIGKLKVSCTALPNPVSANIGTKIDFEPTITGGTPPYNVQWTQGCYEQEQSCIASYDGTSQSLTAKFNVTDSSYPVKTASSSCSATLGSPTNPPVTVDCQPQSQSAVVGTPVTFSANPGGGNGLYTYVWSGSCGCGQGGGCFTDPTCTHTYTGPGVYDVILWAHDSSAPNIKTSNITHCTVHVTRKPGTCPSGQTSCSGCFHSGTCTGPVICGTDLCCKPCTNGPTCAHPNPLKVDGCTANPDSGDSPLAVTFSPGEISGGDGTAYTYKWTGACIGTSANCGPKIFTNVNSTLGVNYETATLTVTSGTETASATCKAAVNNPNATGINIAGCFADPDPATLSGGSFSTVFYPLDVSGGTGPYTYSWTDTANHTGTSENFSVSYTSAQTYMATVTVTDSTGSSAMASCPVSVDTDVSPIFVGGCYADPDPATLSGGSVSTVFYPLDVSGGTGPYTYSWKDNANHTGTSKNFNASYSSAKTYIATVTATDSNGNSAMASCPVSVDAEKYGCDYTDQNNPICKLGGTDGPCTVANQAINCPKSPGCEIVNGVGKCVAGGKGGPCTVATQDLLCNSRCGCDSISGDIVCDTHGGGHFCANAADCSDFICPATPGCACKGDGTKVCSYDEIGDDCSKGLSACNNLNCKPQSYCGCNTSGNLVCDENQDSLNPSCNNVNSCTLANFSCGPYCGCDGSGNKTCGSSDSADPISCPSTGADDCPTCPTQAKCGIDSSGNAICGANQPAENKDCVTADDCYGCDLTDPKNPKCVAGGGGDPCTVATEASDCGAPKVAVGGCYADPDPATLSGGSVSTVFYPLDVSGGTGPYTYSWKDNASPSHKGTSENFSVSYSSANTYIATITATDSNGNSAMASCKVVVDPEKYGCDYTDPDNPTCKLGGTDGPCTVAHEATDCSINPASGCEIVDGAYTGKCIAGGTGACTGATGAYLCVENKNKCGCNSSGDVVCDDTLGNNGPSCTDEAYCTSHNFTCPTIPQCGCNSYGGKVCDTLHHSGSCTDIVSASDCNKLNCPSQSYCGCDSSGGLVCSQDELVSTYICNNADDCSRAGFSCKVSYCGCDGSGNKICDPSELGDTLCPSAGASGCPACPTQARCGIDLLGNAVCDTNQNGKICATADDCYGCDLTDPKNPTCKVGGTDGPCSVAHQDVDCNNPGCDFTDPKNPTCIPGGTGGPCTVGTALLNCKENKCGCNDSGEKVCGPLGDGPSCTDTVNASDCSTFICPAKSKCACNDFGNPVCKYLETGISCDNGLSDCNNLICQPQSYCGCDNLGNLVCNMEQDHGHPLCNNVDDCTQTGADCSAPYCGCDDFGNKVCSPFDTGTTNGTPCPSTGAGDCPTCRTQAKCGFDLFGNPVCNTNQSGANCGSADDCVYGCDSTNPNNPTCKLGGKGGPCTTEHQAIDCNNPGCEILNGVGTGKCVSGGTGASCTVAGQAIDCNNPGCSNGKCVANGTGSSCTVENQGKDCNSHCDSSFKCTSSGTGVPCSSPYDCIASQPTCGINGNSTYCSVGGGGGFCTPGPHNTCSVAPTYCINSKCVPVPLGEFPIYENASWLNLFHTPCTTDANCVIPVPTVITHVDPDPCSNLVNLEWTYQNSVGNKETGFWLQISDDEFAHQAVDIQQTFPTSNFLSSGTPTTQPIIISWPPTIGQQKIEYAKNYKWRVMAYDDKGNNTGWVTGSFSTPAHPWPSVSFTSVSPSSDILINKADVVNFKDTSICYASVGGKISQSSCQQDSAATYAWDFGDPLYSTNSKPANPNTSGSKAPIVYHTYTHVSAPGSPYSPKLTITDDAGSCDFTGAVNVRVPLKIPNWREVSPF